MIYVIGIGPGCRDLMTQEAIAAMEDAEVIVGYKTYIKLVEDFIKDKEIKINQTFEENLNLLKNEYEEERNKTFYKVIKNEQ